MAYKYLDLLPIITEIDASDQEQFRSLLLRLRKNFTELQSVIEVLQSYENNVGVPTDEVVDENKPIWDRSNNINEDGTFPTDKLTEKLVGLQNELQLADEAVTNAKIAVGAIKTPNIDNEAITNAKIAVGAIKTPNIDNEAITNAKIAVGAIKTPNIDNEAITNAKIAVAAIGTIHIGDGVITSDKIVANAVTAAKIQAGAIGADQIAANAISTNKLDAGAVTTDKIKTGAVTAAKIQAGAIGADQIAANAISTNKLDAGAVTTDKIKTGAVTAAKIQAGAIGADQIAANAISTNHIQAGAVTTNKIEAGAVTTAKIQAGAVTADKIEAGTITTEHISADGILGNKITAGQILTYLVELVGEGGYFRVQGDGAKIYDSASNLRAHLGHYETLGPQVAAFTRASTAYKQDGTQVAAGVPRFEAVGEQRGLLVEEGTTNLLTANQASVETDLSGLNDWTTTGQHTFTRDTTRAWHGNACAKVVSNYAGTQTVTIATGNQYTPVTPSKVYTATIHCSGTPGRTFGIGIQWYDASRVFISQAVSSTVPSSDSWTKISLTQTSPANAAYAVIYNILRDAQQNDVLCFDGAQLEQKPYATSWQLPGSTRAAEVLTAPTAGVFTKGSWAIELTFTPTSVQVADGRYAFLWEVYIDANNYYRLIVTTEGKAYLDVASGGVAKSILGSAVMAVGQTYKLMIAGNGSAMRLCQDGAQVGSDIAYTEPIGSLPVNVYIGCARRGAQQANGIISDLRISSRARTLEEHQAYVTSGKPQTVDTDTTMLMSMDGTLQPTVRRFGMWSKNGQIILQDPQTGQGLEVWDGSTRKVLIGRLDDGTIGQEIVGGKLYGSTIRSGGKDDTTFAELAAGAAPFRVVRDGKKALTIWSQYDGGYIQIFNPAINDLCGQIQPSEAYYGNGLKIEARSWTTSKNLALMGDEIYILGDNGTVNYNGFTNFGGSKSNMEITENFGNRALAARESPENRYIDEGMGTLADGVCTIQLDPIFLECIELNSDDTPWIIHITPYADTDLYISEIGADYFVVTERNGGTSNYRFAWSLSAVRQFYANIRLPEVILNNG